MRIKRNYTKDDIRKYFYEFLEQKTDFRKLQPTAIAKYCNEKYDLYPPITYQAFTRGDKEIKKIIDRYNDNLENRLMDRDGNLLVNMDVVLFLDDFYGLTYSQMANKISETNLKLKKISQVNNSLISEIFQSRLDNKNITALYNEEKEKNTKLNVDVSRLRNEKERLLGENKELKKNIILLTEYIKSNITDPVIQQHLVEIGMINKEDIIMVDRKEETMEEAVAHFYQMNEEATILSEKETQFLKRLSGNNET